MYECPLAVWDVVGRISILSHLKFIHRVEQSSICPVTTNNSLSLNTSYAEVKAISFRDCQ